MNIEQNASPKIWQAVCSRPWGKRARDGSGRWHAAEDHMVDVALAFDALVEQDVTQARLMTAAGVPLSRVQLDRLAVLAGLHDIGKLLALFQAKGADANIRAGHVAEFLGALLIQRELAQAMRADLLGAWFSTPSDAIYAAVCHHGGPVPEDRIVLQQANACAALGRTAFGHEPLVEIRRTVDRLLALFPGAFDEAPCLTWTAKLSHLFAGL